MIGSVRIPKRSFAVSSVAALTLGLLAACSLGPDQPRTVAEEFAAALGSGDVEAAAALTDDPDAAADTLSAAFDGLGATEHSFTVTAAEETGDDAGTFSLDASWTFGEGTSGEGTSGEGQTWDYSTSGTAVRVGDEWRVDFDPAVLIPGMTAGQSVRYTPTLGPAPEILSSSGAPLMQEQVVTVVSIDGTADTAALANLLAPIAPTITAQSLTESVAAAQGAPVTAITLRAEDHAPIAAALSAMTGVTSSEQTRLLAVDRDLASPVFGDLTTLWQERQDESAGWAVQLVQPDGTATTIAGQDGTPAEDIATTLDLDLQYAAESALADLPQQAAIVAIAPSTGEVLAVAQNASADALGPIALTGLYPPGSTFKTVTTSAALQSGEVTPDTVLPCPGTENIEGRQIPNDDNFDLGSVPLHTAFARSCNTTMGRLAVGLGPDALTDAALQFGLGIDYVTPGLTTVTGSVPPAETPAARVESAIGQGTVTASPFGMALVAASIADGTTPSPTIVRGATASADRTAPPVPPEVTADLRAMMRETVTAGTATDLADIPGVLGKTGTAETGSGSAHGWFVGITDDLAFAVFVAEGDSSAPAVQAAGRFLR